MLHTCTLSSVRRRETESQNNDIVEHDNNVTYKKVYRQPQISGQLRHTLHGHEFQNNIKLAVTKQYHAMRPLGNLGGAGLALSLIEGVPLGM